MLTFTVRRLLQALVTIVLTTFLVYLGLFVWRDPFSLNGDRYVPLDIQHALRLKFGADRPFFERYLIYLRNLLTGDFGLDYEHRRPVLDRLTAAVPKTLLLALLAIAFQALVGIAAGVFAAIRRRTTVDWLLTTGVTLLFALPVFVIGLFVQRTMAGLSLFGVEIFAPVPRSFTEEHTWFAEAALPALCIGLAGLGIIARVTRGSMAEALAADFVRTARAKGITERRVIVVHALRNALIPVITVFGIEFGTLLGGAFIVEGMFDYPGVGNLFMQSLRENNDPLILAVTVYSLVAYIVVSALVDIGYARVDPRVRVQG
jgi:oligopeptide transport system permease protein